MSLVASKREKYIAYGTGAAILLLVLNGFVLNPYLQAREDVSNNTKIVNQQLSDDRSTLNAKVALQKKWADIQSSGMKTDQAAADSQLQHALLDWAQAAGLSTQVLKADLPRKDGNFLVIGYRMTATGTMRSVAQMIWFLEKAKIPVRLSDVKVNPEKERTDDLTVQISVSTLCEPPDANAPAPAPAAKPAPRPMTAPSPLQTRPTTMPSRPMADNADSEMGAQL